MVNQLKPLDPPYPDTIEQILSQYPKQDGYLLSLFRTFANSERFLKKGVPNLLDKDSPLDLRTREIVILTVTANRKCEYEWGVHVTIFSGAAGLSDEQIAATSTRGRSPWTEAEWRLITCVNQLSDTGRLDENHLTAFQTDWSVEQQLEIINLIGAYSTISCVANIARLQNEAFGARFPTH